MQKICVYAVFLVILWSFKRVIWNKSCKAEAIASIFEPRMQPVK